MNVLVVGAGIIGVAVADALATRGAHVTVLDMRAPGRGASQASAGVLAPYIEAEQDSPLLQLGTRSLALFDTFIGGIATRSSRPIEYARTGTLDLALDAADAARLKASKAWLDARGVRNDWLEGEGLRGFEGSATPSAVGGLYIPQHGFVGVSSLVSALVQSARLSGAWFQSPVEVAHVEAKGDRVEVRAGDLRFNADHVVVAAGSWSRRVRIAGVAPVPVRPVRGQLLHLRWTSTRKPARVVWGPRCYTVPWADGSLLVGATVEDVGFDEGSTVAGVRSLMDAVVELLPDAASASLEYVRVGLRPATPDDLPAIGPVDGSPRVTIASGHYRNGILLAPLTAEIVTSYILDGTIDPVFALTAPGRLL